MPVDLTVSGAMGLKAVAAAKAASAAAKQAAAQAIAMAQNTNLAALQAEQAQANLEKYSIVWKKNPENSPKNGKFPKMGVRRALRARRTPIFGFVFEFSGIFRLDLFFHTIL